MSTPIFVLGSPRNGTTFLSNVISSHPAVCAAQHKAHWGLHESNLYANWTYWNDISDSDELISFIELYSSCDYFRLVDGKKEFFYENPPSDFLEMFFDLMDRYSETEASQYWLTKLDPRFLSSHSRLIHFLKRLDKRYPTAKYIGIQRNFRDVARSHLNMQGKKTQQRGHIGIREFSLLLESARYQKQYTEIRSLIADRNGLMIPYSTLQEKRKKVTLRISDYLDVESSPRMMTDAFPPNSSFSGGRPENSIPEWEMSFLQHAVRPFFDWFPPFARVILLIRDLFRPQPSPALYWRLLKLDTMPDRFQNELRRSGNVGLLNHLFS